MNSGTPDSGFFVTLYDKETLNLYLERGVYGFLMNPEIESISKYSRHYAALADYACGREGTHVFFFLKRHIHYGGQLVGGREYGSFYLNGRLSPMGIKANAPLVWDESDREIYNPTKNEGVFLVKGQDGWKEKCQPYLIRFEDRLGLKGRNVVSDEFYWRLGEFRHPLPSNTIQGMSFCTLTPGECEILLDILTSKRPSSPRTREKIEFESDPVPFDPKHGIQKLTDAANESHLEASVLANPELLPAQLSPKGATLCRQVPMSPLKPYQMDRADICYFSEDVIERGTIPNTVIELKHKKAGKAEVEQVVRYAKWLKVVAPAALDRIQLYVFAPDYTRTAPTYVPREYQTRIRLLSYGEDEGQTRLA